MDKCVTADQLCELDVDARQERARAMLRSVNGLQGYAVHATDGLMGHVHDFYFDDATWTVRHLVVETGSLLNHRRVLISPLALGLATWETRGLTVTLSTEKVRHSPPIDLDRPISRQHEAGHYDYYAWPYYWHESSTWEAGMLMPVSPEAKWSGHRTEQTREQARTGDPHLRSTREVTGYHLQAADGKLGHVEDFAVDDRSWSIRYIVADTSNWWLGKKVLIAPAWVTEICWAERLASVGLVRKTIQASPAWDHGVPTSLRYEVELYSYYGRPLHKAEPEAT